MCHNFPQFVRLLAQAALGLVILLPWLLDILTQGCGYKDKLPQKLSLQHCATQLSSEGFVVILGSGGLFFSRVFNSNSATITNVHKSKSKLGAFFLLSLAVVITLPGTFCNVRRYAWLSVLLLACCGWRQGTDTIWHLLCIRLYHSSPESVEVEIWSRPVLQGL